MCEKQRQDREPGRDETRPSMKEHQQFTSRQRHEKTPFPQAHRKTCTDRHTDRHTQF